MKAVIITSGPQGAGKSTYTKKVCACHPEITLISRDDILIQRYGTTHFNPYAGGAPHIEEELMRLAKRSLRKKHSAIIFDHWNGFPETRKRWLERFKTFGVDKVVCWKFITPLSICDKWYKKRENRSFYSAQNYHYYHETSADIHFEGFDYVEEIFPLQLTIPRLPFIELNGHPIR